MQPTPAPSPYGRRPSRNVRQRRPLEHHGQWVAESEATPEPYPRDAEAAGARAWDGARGAARDRARTGEWRSTCPGAALQRAAPRSCRRSTDGPARTAGHCLIQRLAPRCTSPSTPGRCCSTRGKPPHHPSATPARSQGTCFLHDLRLSPRRYDDVSDHSEDDGTLLFQMSRWSRHPASVLFQITIYLPSSIRAPAAS